MSIRSATVALAFTFALALALALAGTAHATDVALGARAATAGLGPEVTIGIGRALDLRFAGGFYSYDTTYDKTGIHYDATVKLRNVIGTVDIHPLLGGFRLSVGAAWDDNRLEVSAPVRELVRRYRPDLVPLLPADTGTIHGDARGDQVAPYGGIGWGRPFAGGRVGLSLDLGVLYHGNPRVHLHTDLPAGIVLPPQAQTVLDAATRDEEGRLEDELRTYRFLPVAGIGVSVRL